MKKSVDEGHDMERRVEKMEPKYYDKKTPKKDALEQQTKKKLYDALKGK